MTLPTFQYILTTILCLFNGGAQLHRKITLTHFGNVSCWSCVAGRRYCDHKVCSREHQIFSVTIDHFTQIFWHGNQFDRAKVHMSQTCIRYIRGLVIKIFCHPAAFYTNFLKIQVNWIWRDEVKFATDINKRRQIDILNMSVTQWIQVSFQTELRCDGQFWTAHCEKPSVANRLITVIAPCQRISDEDILWHINVLMYDCKIV